MLLWALTLTPLAWLALLFYPGRGPFESVRLTRVFGTGLLAYVSYQWTVWMRYFILKSNGRKVIGFSNYDVSPAGFWVQEFQTILFWMLLSLVCFQWLQFGESVSVNAHEGRNSLQHVTSRLSTSFSRWQLTSILLALSCFPFASFSYWDMVVHSKDLRFFPGAIILHVIWAVAWVAISVPLYLAWSNWRLYKTLAMERVVTVAESNGDTIIKALEAAEPIGDWTKAISATLTALSFLGPVIKVFLK